MPKNITSVEWQAQDIPSGLAFDKATGTFTGTPSAAGDFTVPVSVTTNYGSDTKNVLVKAAESEEIIDTSNSRYITECVDDGEKIIFFGNYNNGSRGIFFTYNPISEIKSDTFDIFDGRPLTVNDVNNTSENYAFKEAAIDPVSKKWLAFFGTHYVRTHEGVKDLGSDINLNSMVLCWSDTLQKFCVIANSTTSNELTSYLFDVDGNLLDSSTQIRDIENFKFKAVSRGKNLNWSNTAGKFAAVSSQMISPSQPYRVTIYSSDGLNWNSSIINDYGYSNYQYGIDTESLITLDDGTFILSSVAAYGLANPDFVTSFHKSIDGINWTRCSGTISWVSFSIAWNNSKEKFYALTNGSQNKSSQIYVSQDLSNWQLIKTLVKFDISIDYDNSNLSPVKMIYSDTANALVIPALNKDFYIGQV